MKRLRCLGIAATFLLVTHPALALERVIISFDDVLPTGIAEELTLRGAEHGAVLPSINAVAVEAPMAVLETYRNDPRVKAITRQRPLTLHLYSSVEQIQASGVDAPESVTLESGETAERPGVTGAGITVGVIDSGVFAAHPDLLGRVNTGLNFEFSLLYRQLSGVVPVDVWDLWAEATGPVALQDEVGHGTHVAGTIGGSGAAASGLTMAGVAPGVEIVAFKIASGANGVVEDIGFEANAVAAIDYLIRHNADLGIRVTNNSWGILAEEAQGLFGPTDFDPLEAIVRSAAEAGIVMVFSAGNDGPGPDTVRPIPNAMDEVISVAAACKRDFGSCPEGQVTGFSSRGASVDVTAPGDQILAAQSPSVLAPIGQALEGDYFGDAPQDELQNRAAYMRLSGTSMSSPHVAGVVALLLEANPDLTPADVRQILIDTADDMVVEGSEELLPGFDNASGYGMVNVRKALLAAVGVEPAADESQPAPERAAQPVAGGALSFGLLSLLLMLRFRRR